MAEELRNDSHSDPVETSGDVEVLTIEKSLGSSAGRSDYILIRVDQLPVGARLKQPVYDARQDSKQLLLAAGQKLLPFHLVKLKQRGIQQVLVHRQDVGPNISQIESSRSDTGVWAASKGAKVRAASETEGTRAASWSGWKVDPESVLHRIQPLDQLARDPQRAATFQTNYDQRVTFVRGLVQSLLKHQVFNVDLSKDVCAKQLGEIVEDLDEFLIRSTSPIFNDYPYRHGLQLSMLATGMATVMGFSEADLSSLSLGCMIHDVGMLLLPRRIIEGQGPLNKSDRLEIQKHPILAANLLQDCSEFSQQSRHVVYQMHERMNGTGYPRGRWGTQIHPLARVAAVADTYLSLVSPRPFRPALLPYQAVEKILLSTQQGLFDPGAVRALLHAVSLFPIGSHVQLSNGQLGRVVRSQRANFDRPVVEVDDLYGVTGTTRVINLVEQTNISVVAALPAPEAKSSESDKNPIELTKAAAAL